MSTPTTTAEAEDEIEDGTEDGIEEDAGSSAHVSTATDHTEARRRNAGKTREMPTSAHLPGAPDSRHRIPTTTTTTTTAADVVQAHRRGAVPDPPVREEG